MCPSCGAKRRGRWVVDAYIHGHRIVRSFKTKREAEDYYAELRDERQAKAKPVVNAFVRLREYAPRFLADCKAAEMAPSSMRLYTGMLEKHIIPELGDLQIRELRRPRVRTFLQGLGGRGTRKASHSVLSGLLAMAVDDQIISSNPARDLIRRRRVKAKTAGERARDVKAMNRNQRDRFLAAAAGEPELYTASLIEVPG